MKIFAGRSNEPLAHAIVKRLRMELGKMEIFTFSNENLFVRILENVRDADVFLIQTSASPVDTHLVELLVMIDAFRRASAQRITAVLPYYPYVRSDQKDQPRIPVTARLVADLLETAGANRVLTMDLHSAQIMGFFRIPVDHLTAMPLVASYFQKKNLSNLVVVATDVGGSKRCRKLAELLKADLAIIEKRREDSETKVMSMIGTVEGKTALIFDDEVCKGDSILEAVDLLQQKGAKPIYAAVTHAVLAQDAADRITACTELQELVVTDTLPLPEEKRRDKITALTVAPLFAEAMRRIHLGESVSALLPPKEKVEITEPLKTIVEECLKASFEART